ncbi:MAG TPA: Ig domain-containing protein [Acidimicrobiales bacterium]|nr:Ig domain-containing protein [Acidimicrobiales bacterium]
MGSRYSETLSASGSISPLTWTVSGGSLPPGLTLASNGIVSGSPIQPGAYSATVTATDSGNPAGTASALLSFPILSGPLGSTGYGIVDTDGTQCIFASNNGQPQSLGWGAPPSDLFGPVVATVTDPAIPGASWETTFYGDIAGIGAPTFGSMLGKQLTKPIVSMASTPDGKGYWMLGADGGIFAFGDAGYYGSFDSLAFNCPSDGCPPPPPFASMASTPDGNGYWMIGNNGAIYSFCDAGFYGSGPGSSTNQVIGLIQ